MYGSNIITRFVSCLYRLAAVSEFFPFMDVNLTAAGSKQRAEVNFINCIIIIYSLSFKNGSSNRSVALRVHVKMRVHVSACACVCACSCTRTCPPPSLHPSLIGGQ